MLDGELVIYDPNRGRPWFPLLNRRITAGRALDAEVARRPATYVVFDLLQDAGVDMTSQPYARPGPDSNNFSTTFLPY